MKERINVATYKVNNIIQYHLIDTTKRKYKNRKTFEITKGILDLVKIKYALYCYRNSNMIDPSSSEEDTDDEHHKKQPSKLPGKDY